MFPFISMGDIQLSRSHLGGMREGHQNANVCEKGEGSVSHQMKTFAYIFFSIEYLIHKLQ